MTHGMKWAVTVTTCLMVFIGFAVFLDWITPGQTPEEKYQEVYNRCVTIKYANKGEIDDCNKMKRPNELVPPTSAMEAFTPVSTGVGIKEYETEYAKKWEANKAQWLKENPPVEFLFDTERRMDKDYVLYYLKNNRISGDCGLAFLEDVVCWSEGGQLQFPTERPALDKQ